MYVECYRSTFDYCEMFTTIVASISILKLGIWECTPSGNFVASETTFVEYYDSFQGGSLVSHPINKSMVMTIFFLILFFNSRTFCQFFLLKVALFFSLHHLLFSTLVGKVNRNSQTRLFKFFFPLLYILFSNSQKLISLITCTFR